MRITLMIEHIERACDSDINKVQKCIVSGP